MPLASDWSNILTALLPFALLIGFWLYLTRNQRRHNPQEGVVAKLEEIRQELERLRKSIESRP